MFWGGGYIRINRFSSHFVSQQDVVNSVNVLEPRSVCLAIGQGQEAG